MIKKRFFKTRDECEVSFILQPDNAQEVALLCEANGWEPIPMKQLKDGRFKTQLRLPINREYQFLYLLDGETWQNDEAADAYTSNTFGGDNSIVSTVRG